jgi:CheY-like chemotaxis protein
MDGFEVLKRIKEDPVLANILVAVLTSSSEAKDRTNAMKLGADLYLQKAVDFHEFLNTLRYVETLLCPV